MRADAEANHEAIIDAAIVLFADVGLAASTRAVASAAGVGIGTLYRHFPTREDLVIGVAKHVMGRVNEAAVRCGQQWDAGPEAAWRKLVTDLVALRPGRLIAQVADAAEIGGLTDREHPIMRRRREVLAVLEGILDRAKAAGLVHGDVRADAFAIGIAQLSRPLSETVDDLVPGWEQWLVEVYVRGLRP